MRLTPLVLALLAFSPARGAAWRPDGPVEIIVPAAGGSGADRLARVVAAFLEKRSVKATVTVLGPSAAGYLRTKSRRGDPRTLLLAESALLALPAASGVQFHWKDYTPIGRLALDRFALWVRADARHKTLADFIEAARASPGRVRLAGTGTVQEDRVVALLLERAAGIKLAYLPSGKDVAKSLAARLCDSTVSNPSEMAAAWRGGEVRPLALFEEKRLTDGPWSAIPTALESGLDVRYRMMYGVFGAGRMPKAAAAFYAQLLRELTESPGFREFAAGRVLDPAWLSGSDFDAWLEDQDRFHRQILGGIEANR